MVWGSFLITFALFVGMIWFTGYGIYQFFQEQWLASIASLLIFIVLEKWLAKMTSLLEIPFRFMKSFEEHEEELFEKRLRKKDYP